jgi:single-stranded-DNA-specific exonuclease
MEKRWKILPVDQTSARSLQSDLRINEVLCQLLVQRNIRTFDMAKDFFRPQMSALHDPWLMKDMRAAVDRILIALQRGEKMLIYGDYDVDGTTAVACLFQFLRKVCSPGTLDFYIPNRYREGYGVSKTGVDYAGQQGYSLIVSLDCGIKSVDLIAYAAALGIDFIVCDHHLPDDELPPAVAILNPKQPGCLYPYKELCGCGVGYKLITALCEQLGFPPEEAYQYLDLVTTAIAADIVPVDGENRVLAYYGLKKVNENPNHGIRALIELSGLTRVVKMINLVFMIAPRVNAAGRMDDARKVVHLFIESNPALALAYASQLQADNTDRKEADTSMTEEALAILESETASPDRRSTVLYQPHWHKGVIGIVASRVIERYYRPTVILTRSGEVISGSARSVNGFNVYEAVHACREYLLGYGGHFAAAGITLLPDQVEAFTHKFEETVAATIGSESLFPELIVDAHLPFDAIRQSFYNIVEQMQPFGPSNTQPVFVSRNVTDSGSRIVKEQHIRFALRQGDTYMEGIGFGLSAKFPLLQCGNPVDIVYNLEENEWNNQKSLQLKVIDLAPSECAGIGPQSRPAMPLK